jgi:precorrin-3B C17-methyltransferase
MLTTVLIGNSSTFIEQGLMITPRGYANKYDSLSGETKQGEQAGRSLSMGLEGWKACLRQYLNLNKELSWEKAADYFDVPVGEVLSAVALGSEENTLTEAYQAAQVDDNKLEQLIEACKNWGRLRSVIRTGTGAIVELFLQGEDFKRKGDWLNIENDAFHLHVNWNQVSTAYFASRSKQSYGLHFIDQHGRLVFRLLLTKLDGEFNIAQLENYQQAWNTFSLNNTQEQTND